MLPKQLYTSIRLYGKIGIFKERHANTNVSCHEPKSIKEEVVDFL